MDQLELVFAYRAFDLRDRFPQPFPTFRAALEALQSESAYMPEWFGQITAYLRDGREVEIPTAFYIVKEPRFKNRQEAEDWVKERAEAIANKRHTRLMGALIANADDPIEKQIENALRATNSTFLKADRNDAVCDAVELWLRAAIRALPSNAELALLKGLTPYTAHQDELAEWESSPPVGRELGGPDNPWD